MSSNATEASGSLPPGQAPPFAVITPTDQTGVVFIATSLALIFAFISILIRVFIRFEFRNQFAADDVTAMFAMVLFIIQSGLVFAAASHGFGKTSTAISDADLLKLQREIYAGDLLYIVSLWLTKCSVAFIFLRISPDRIHKALSNMCLVVPTLFMVVSVFTVALRCHLTAPWIFVDRHCVGLLARWQAVTALDIVSEVALLGLAVYLIYGLQLRYIKKFVVIVAFGLRIPVIPASLLRLHYLGVELASHDPTLDAVLASVCTQIQLSYAIIAMTTPCLRPFMSALNTNYGGQSRTGISPNATKLTRTAKSDNEYSLSSVSRPVPAKDDSRDSPVSDFHVAVPSDCPDESKETGPATRWDHTDYRVTVVSSDGRSIHSAESQRMIISKNTEWHVEYNHEDHPRE